MPYPMVGEERMESVLVREKFGDSLIKVKMDRGETFLCVKRDQIAHVLQFLRDEPQLEYNYFVECVGVDYLTWTHERDFTERFEVVYNLMSLKHNSRIFVKVAANDGDKVPTCKHVFLGADYPEREIWDLLGVVFAGNEQTDRFLLPEDWVGHPLRKDVTLGGEDVKFFGDTTGPAVEDVQKPHAGESFEGLTGSSN